MTKSATQTNRLDQSGWYARSVFSVADMTASLQHYGDLLGFTQSWHYDENQRTIVTQVNKGALELILASNVDHLGPSRLFISLEQDELSALKDRVQHKAIPYTTGFWGYPVMLIQDPDGNELLFPLED